MRLCGWLCRASFFEQEERDKLQDQMKSFYPKRALLLSHGRGLRVWKVGRRPENCNWCCRPVPTTDSRTTNCFNWLRKNHVSAKRQQSSQVGKTSTGKKEKGKKRRKLLHTKTRPLFTKLNLNLADNLHMNWPISGFWSYYTSPMRSVRPHWSVRCNAPFPSFSESFKARKQRIRDVSAIKSKSTLKM